MRYIGLYVCKTRFIFQLENEVTRTRMHCSLNSRDFPTNQAKENQKVKRDDESTPYLFPPYELRTVVGRQQDSYEYEYSIDYFQYL